MGSHKSIAVLMFVVFTATTGYGISFPLLAISLESMGFSSTLIGLNAAMPALGWIIASLLIPSLHKRYSTRTLMVVFLVLAIVGLAGFALVKDYTFWLLCRLLFGGGLGMFFRTLEYHLNSTVAKDKRGKILGIYITFFLCGIVVGSVIQPVFGIDTLWPYVFIFLCLTISLVCLFGSGIKSSPDQQLAGQSIVSAGAIKNLFLLVPVAATGVLVYGLVESIAAYLMPVYALKVGFDDATAAYTLTAFAVGNVLFALPLGWLSDKIGRLPVIYGCAIAGLISLVLVPFVIANTTLFFAALVVLGGCIVGLYSISLALIGDHFPPSELIYANATFGILYACGSLVGPVMHGTAMDIYEPHGMIVSAALMFILFLIFAATKRSGTNMR